MLSLAHKQLISLLLHPPSRHYADCKDDIYQLFSVLAREHGISRSPGENDFHFAIEIPLLATKSIGGMYDLHTQFLVSYEPERYESELLTGPFRHHHFTDVNRLYEHLTSFGSRWSRDEHPYRILLLTGEVFETRRKMLALFEGLEETHPYFSETTYFNSLILPRKHPLLRPYMFNNVLTPFPQSGL